MLLPSVSPKVRNSMLSGSLTPSILIHPTQRPKVSTRTDREGKDLQGTRPTTRWCRGLVLRLANLQVRVFLNFKGAGASGLVVTSQVWLMGTPTSQKQPIHRNSESSPKGVSSFVKLFGAQEQVVLKRRDSNIPPGSFLRVRLRTFVKSSRGQ